MNITWLKNSNRWEADQLPITPVAEELKLGLYQEQYQLLRGQNRISRFLCEVHYTLSHSASKMLHSI